jgi:hypothetical protein
LVETQQLDIFIPLQRTARLHAWAELAREEGFDAATTPVPEFARWVEAHGLAPAGFTSGALELLVAVMQEYESPGALHAQPR